MNTSKNFAAQNGPFFITSHYLVEKDYYVPKIDRI